MIRPGQSNVKEAFSKFSGNVDKMDHIGNRILDHSEKMSEQGKEYFSEWRKQGNNFTNPEIQALSEQRRADLSAMVAKISESGVGIKGGLKAYLIKVKEVRSYLSNDLTEKGIKTISPVANEAMNDGASLKEATEPWLAAIVNAKAALAHSGVKM